MSVRRAVLGQFDVVHALILRETRTRFGAHQLGYLWAIIEPALWIATLYTIFAVLDRRTPAGMPLISFLLTGLIPYQLFISTVNRVGVAIGSNRALLFYPQVRPLELVVARATLEFATSIAVFSLFILGDSLAMQQWPRIEDPLMVVLGFALAMGFGLGLGLIFCALSVVSKLAERIRSPMMRPLFWCSGIFFTANDLPSEARDYLLYNPLLHAVELIRDGWFISYQARHADIGYVLIWIAALVLIGLLFERVARRRIEVS